MAFDPIQEDCHRLVLEALRRDNIPLTDGAAVERLMEQFTHNPAPLIVHDRDRAGPVSYTHLTLPTNSRV